MGFRYDRKSGRSKMEGVDRRRTRYLAARVQGCAVRGAMPVPGWVALGRRGGGAASGGERGGNARAEPTEAEAGRREPKLPDVRTATRSPDRRQEDQ